MAEEKKKAVDKPKKPILPTNNDKPSEFRVVYFKYIGDSVKFNKATLTAYVSPKIAKIYEEKLKKCKEKNLPCAILKVE